MTVHSSVLLTETIKLLNINKDGIYVDLTGGGGGHSQEIINSLSAKGKLFIFDQDENAIAHLQQKFQNFKNVFIIKSNFASFDKALQLFQINKVDGIIADLGLSSDQLADETRGFSYMNSVGNLDMRMDKTGNSLLGLDIINNYDENQLDYIFRTFGECNNSYRLASEIVKKRPLRDASDLIKICDTFKKGNGHSAKRVFQALRIYINDELETLKAMLEKAVTYLKQDGTFLVITFHSLEDRIVKQFFNSLTKTVIDKRIPIAVEPTTKFTLLTNKAIKPSDEEIKTNPRARSALLRGIKRKQSL